MEICLRGPLAITTERLGWELGFSELWGLVQCISLRKSVHAKGNAPEEVSKLCMNVHWHLGTYVFVYLRGLWEYWSCAVCIRACVLVCCVACMRAPVCPLSACVIV